MKIQINNKYGFKVCYTTKKYKNKYKLVCVTNTYSLAQLSKNLYVKHQDKKDKLDWYILPIRKREYKKLWKDCPF